VRLCRVRFDLILVQDIDVDRHAVLFFYLPYWFIDKIEYIGAAITLHLRNNIGYIAQWIKQDLNVLFSSKCA